MADGDVSAEHRAAHGSVALESGREVERPGRAGIFRWECGAWSGADSAFVWLSAAASWGDARRRHGHGGVFAADGWESGFVLEEQSVSDAGVYRRERRCASAMGVSRSGEFDSRERDSNRVGRTVR